MIGMYLSTMTLFLSLFFHFSTGKTDERTAATEPRYLFFSAREEAIEMKKKEYIIKRKRRERGSKEKEIQVEDRNKGREKHESTPWKFTSRPAETKPRNHSNKRRVYITIPSITSLKSTWY